MTKQISDGLYLIDVPLPRTPLKNLNAYLIRGERNLLVDTGFNAGICYEALRGGLDQLGAKPENTDIFITHLHSDHSGLAYRLQRDSTRVFISDEDLARVDLHNSKASWAEFDGLYLSEGFPENELAQMPEQNVARSFAPARNCSFTKIFADDMFSYGDYNFRCVATPGHTPGHMCLYDEASETMILGDHILFDITPNITLWPGVPDPLGDYIESLAGFKNIPIKTPLPGHRGVSCTVGERIDQITEHHKIRLEEIVSVVTAQPGMTAYEIASKMTWHIRVEGWDNFPMSQKWFAVGEVLAHLRFLEHRGAIERYEEHGVSRYTLPARGNKGQGA